MSKVMAFCNEDVGMIAHDINSVLKDYKITQIAPVVIKDYKHYVWVVYE